jgi:hypothetical protein
VGFGAGEADLVERGEDEGAGGEVGAAVEQGLDGGVARSGNGTGNGSGDGRRGSGGGEERRCWSRRARTEASERRWAARAKEATATREARPGRRKSRLLLAAERE